MQFSSSASTATRSEYHDALAGAYPVPRPRRRSFLVVELTPLSERTSIATRSACRLYHRLSDHSVTLRCEGTVPAPQFSTKNLSRSRRQRRFHFLAEVLVRRLVLQAWWSCIPPRRWRDGWEWEDSVSRKWDIEDII